MALATRCPACSTVFRISTAQAAAKGGMVRCGHCRNVFNSLDALVRVEDLEIVEEASVAMAEPPAVVPAEAVALPAEAAGSSTSAFPAPTSIPDEEFRSAPPAVADARENDFVHTEVSSVLASLSTPTTHDAVIQEWWMPDPAPLGRNIGVPAALSAVTRPRSEADAAEEPPPAPGGAATESGDLLWSGVGATGSVFMRPPFVPRASRTARWTWAALSLVAAVVLMAQVVHRWRDEIAVRWPPARPYLVTACTVLDCKVGYPADADAITIESASVQATAAGSNLYVLTALLRNRESLDVRYPHLDLVLTDTNDRPVLRRVLRPEDYLTALRDGDRAVAPPAPGFPAQSELAVRVTFELTNLRFAGYRVERFYP